MDEDDVLEPGEEEQEEHPVVEREPNIEDGEPTLGPWATEEPPAALLGTIPATISVDVWAGGASLQVSIGSGYTSYWVYVREGGIGEAGPPIYEETFYYDTDFAVGIRLTGGKTYTANVRSDPGNIWGGAVEFTVPTVSVYPWSWWSNIWSGALFAFSENGKMVSMISAAEWEAFCDRINQVRTELMGYYEWSFTRPQSRRTPMTADIINEAWDAISEMGWYNPYLPTRARQGETALNSAEFFNGLKDALNYFI